MEKLSTMEFQSVQVTMSRRSSTSKKVGIAKYVRFYRNRFAHDKVLRRFVFVTISLALTMFLFSTSLNTQHYPEISNINSRAVKSRVGKPLVIRVNKERHLEPTARGIKDQFDKIKDKMKIFDRKDEQSPIHLDNRNMKFKKFIQRGDDSGDALADDTGDALADDTGDLEADDAGLKEVDDAGDALEDDTGDLA
eukprot:63325_1